VRVVVVASDGGRPSMVASDGGRPSTVASDGGERINGGERQWWRRQQLR